MFDEVPHSDEESDMSRDTNTTANQIKDAENLMQKILMQKILQNI